MPAAPPDAAPAEGRASCAPCCVAPAAVKAAAPALRPLPEPPTCTEASPAAAVACAGCVGCSCWDLMLLDPAGDASPAASPPRLAGVDGVDAAAASSNEPLSVNDPADRCSSSSSSCCCSPAPCITALPPCCSTVGRAPLKDFREDTLPTAAPPACDCGREAKERLAAGSQAGLPPSPPCPANPSTNCRLGDDLERDAVLVRTEGPRMRSGDADRSPAPPTLPAAAPSDAPNPPKLVSGPSLLLLALVGLTLEPRE
mmetsp:Transcript_8258/g.20592  ORF Transcript_8258/g.20592 Transcript_8258/m.20592 type:complete len:256 (-) Transcript_8258:977-1744(-)